MHFRATLLGIAGALSLSATTALAQTYPERPISLIIAFGAGGATDVGVRTITPALGRCLDGEVVVINRPGASGDLAYAEAAEAAPDGYTLVNLNMPGVITNTLVQQTAYSVDDFTPLGTVTGSAVFFAVANDSPWDSMDDLIEAARESPTPLIVATGSLGSSDHLAMLQLSRATGVDFVFLPLDSSAASFTSVMGGHAPIAVASGAAQFEGEVKLLGVAADNRLDSMPHIPTLIEQGYEVGGGAMHILAGPNGMPEDVVERLRECVAEVPNDETFRQEAELRGMEIIPNTAEEVEEMIAVQRRVLTELWETDPWIEQ